MSRTIRKKLAGYHPVRLKETGDSYEGWTKNRKMRPYSKERAPMKYKATHTEYTPGNAKGVSRYDKLITKNANRSLKKGERQNGNKFIKNEIEHRYDNI